MSLKTKLNSRVFWTALTGLFAAALAAIVCYFLKDEVLGCHDSFEEFIFARMHGFSDWFKHNLDFNLARGRVGFITSFVFTFRFYVLSTGNYLAVWLLQQVPIWITVGLIGFTVGKKTRPVYGFLFVAFFAAFIQIDTNHNLMDCYPFDFMYGMSLMVLGLYFYDSWLCHMGKRGNIVRIILSAFFYYESMTVYEPFITACAIYALISFSHVFKARKELGVKKAVIRFITRLIPHAATAALFFVILKLMKVFYVVEDVTVTAVDEYGDFGDFVNTWNTFTFALFPLHDIENVDVGTSFLTLFSWYFIPVFSFCAAGAVFSAFMAARTYSSEDKASHKEITFNLFMIALAGFFYAMLFCLPHSMTANYQMWVRDLHAEGYLTSSMCYFGWALMFSCLISMLINVLAGVKKAVYIPVAVAFALLFFLGAELTMNINLIFKKRDATTGRQMSYRGQVFYSFFGSDYAEDYSAILVYMKGYNGIHFDIQIDDAYADYEVNRDMVLTNDIDVYHEQCLYHDFSGFFEYDPTVEAGWYTSIANPGDPVEDWVSSGDLVLVSSRPGSYEFSYEDPDTGETVTQNVDIGRMELFVIHNSEPVDTDTVEIALR